MDNQHIQQHIQTVREAIGVQKRIGAMAHVLILPEHAESLINAIDDITIALKASFKVGDDLATENESLRRTVEQQQREIERLRLELGRIANYCHLGESFHTSITRCIKIAATALSPNKEVSTNVQDDR